MWSAFDPGWGSVFQTSVRLTHPAICRTVGLVKAIEPPAKRRLSPPRYERLEARVTPELKALLLDAAAMRGVTLSDFLINSAHDAAVRTVEQHKLIRLNREASVQFANALLHPPRPNARLRAASRRYRQIHLRQPQGTGR
jgi:uncharacterized protein (DUF1778 family)